MLSPERPDRIRVAFDDHRVVTNAGLLLPVTLAGRLDLRELVDRHIDLDRAPGQANAGDKMMTRLASALAGRDCIDGVGLPATLSTSLAVPRQAGTSVSPSAICPLILPVADAGARQESPLCRRHNQRLSQSVGINALPVLPLTFHLPSDQPHRIPSVDSG